MQLLFDTSTIRPELVVSKKYLHVRATPSPWKLVSEPLPTRHSLGNTDTRDRVSSDVPHEQLTLTDDDSDYAFYVARFERCAEAAPSAAPCAAPSIALRFEAADFVRVFVDGRPVATSQLPLWEDRWRNQWAQYPDGERGTAHQLTVPDIYDQAFELCIMCNALGLVKGDWQLNNQNMAFERKGLLSDVQVSGWQRCSQWQCVGRLVGEVADYVNQLHNKDSKPLQNQEQQKVSAESPVWGACELKVSRPSDSWVLDLAGFGKGVLWVNGHLLGRFWDIKGTRGIHGFLTGSPIVQDEPGTYTQRYYHVPNWVLPESPSTEELVLRVTMFLEASLQEMRPLKLMEVRVDPDETSIQEESVV
ncbi:beta-galactosidase [Gracilaria domingensis]|nr:beta-galactosidase [Gracilaria domingensis]